MEKDIMKKNLTKGFLICGICFLFVGLNSTPMIRSISSKNPYLSILMNNCSKSSDGDIATWYQADQWIYTIDPLFYSSPNGSFSGTIENFKQKVVGVVNGLYKLEITGDISGILTMNGFSGPLSGDITGISYIRVSDLAEVTTELHSQGTITVIIPFPYKMNLVTSSSPPLEVYDFPFNIGEQWQVTCLSTMSGSFTIQSLYNQSLNGSQWISETVECTQKEQMSVPAGVFECFKIIRSNTMVWYSSDVGNMVKSSIDQSDENITVHAVITLESFIRNSQPITISEDISPAVTRPGVSVDISGQALTTESGDPVQNGAVSIEIPSTGDSWSTMTNSDGYYSKTIIAPTMNDDTTCGRETGSGGVIVQCISGNLTGYRVQTLTTLQNSPPNTPSIDGETKGKVGISYSYIVLATDPDDDEVFYFVDWGDMTNSSWIGPSPSNEEVIINHTFTKKGSYTIKVIVRDVYNAESDWRTLQVNMPKLTSYLIPLKFFERFSYIFFLLYNFLKK